MSTESKLPYRPFSAGLLPTPILLLWPSPNHTWSNFSFALLSPLQLQQWSLLGEHQHTHTPTPNPHNFLFLLLTSTAYTLKVMVIDWQLQELMITEDRNHLGQNSTIIFVVIFIDSESIPGCRESFTCKIHTKRHVITQVKVILWSLMRHLEPFYLLLISVKYTIFVTDLILLAEKYPLVLYHHPEKRGEVGRNNFSKVKVKCLLLKRHLRLDGLCTQCFDVALFF